MCVVRARGLELTAPTLTIHNLLNIGICSNHEKITRMCSLTNYRRTDANEHYSLRTALFIGQTKLGINQQVKSRYCGLTTTIAGRAVICKVLALIS